MFNKKEYQINNTGVHIRISTEQLTPQE